MSSHADARGFRAAIALTLCMFAIWGVAHRLYDTLLPDFAAALALTPTQQSLAEWALSCGYYVMALPAALISRNFGYKSGVVFGLGTFAVGLFLFYPAAAHHAFAWLALAALVVGSGLAILEVSADPLVVRLGPRRTAVRRLNAAQALNPLGVLAGFFLGEHLLRANAGPIGADLATSVIRPLFYIGAGVLLFAFLVDNTRFPTVAIARVTKDDSTVRSFQPLFHNRLFMLGAGALFLCSSAQVVMWGFAARYAEIGGMSAAVDVVFWCLLAFTAGRFIGTVLMHWIDPARLLAAFAVGGTLCAGTAALSPGLIGVGSLVGASFFLSIVFPTVFGSAIRDLDRDTKTGSAMLMFAAGSGAAVLALLSLIATPAIVPYLMIVPAACFAAIAAFALHVRRAAPRL